jgi:hypothetical protein
MVVGILKYIGPFLRINTLTRENIEKQLSYFARESFKHIVLNSRCGITSSMSDFKLKNIPNFDISIFKKFSPLLCVYKKANPKVIATSSMSWDENTFKKELNISSSAYMTLTCLELIPYYSQFKDIDSKHYAFGRLYSLLVRKQLDFYTSYMRNSEGVFVDKRDVSDSIADKYIFEEKDRKFKYSDQALLMAAFYKAGTLPDNKDGEAYKVFALDILNMFLEYKDELYYLSSEETNKLCLAINLFYKYSENEDAKLLLIDLCDFLIDNHSSSIEAAEDEDIEFTSMLYINLLLGYENTKLQKFKDYSTKLYERLQSLYKAEKGIFTKAEDKKEVDYSCQEIVMYLMSVLLHSRFDVPDKDNHIAIDIFKRQLISSGIILSWPDTPGLDNPERYTNFSLKSEDLLEETNFRMGNVPTPESSEMAPVFIKNIEYNTRKETFSQKKATFDSTKNMPLLFLMNFLLGLSRETVELPDDVEV